ncbi:MAG: putative Ig domain-containing protein, partial [Planctomycetes bacterium]|nr:putative Ig domain-containing protein [Planctomycetota bacterium]
DLIGDGWSVIRHDVNASDSVTSVKALIKADYQAAPTQVKSVFLFGRVPQPRSGYYSPDGHSDHYHQQPCDGYYGDMDGAWTDTVTHYANPDTTWRNNPGDGYFDQNVFPSDIELGVGRVELSNLWSFSGGNEILLLRQYLDKDHKFRQRLVTMERRCLIQDGFDSGGGIGSPAASAWRLSGNVGSYSSFTSGPWVPTAASQSFLWAYGCGGGGPNGFANGSLTSSMLASNTVNVAFTMLFGSYFGDWTYDNNFMRSVLASSPTGLSCSWSGWPQHHYFHMGLGEPIGNSMVVSQNNDGALYSSGGFNYRAVHIGLMGDPTLVQYPVIPPSGLGGSVSGSTVNLTWAASAEATLGYHVFRATSADGPYTRITASPVATTSYADASVPGGTHTYLVRAAKMEVSPSGTFVNLSPGVFTTVTVSGSSPGSISFSSATSSVNENAGQVTITVRRTGGTSGAVSVSYATSNGTATAGSDYTSASGTLTWAAGTSADKTFTVQIIDNTTNEPNETVNLTLSAPTNGATLASPSTAVVTIIDDDPAVVTPVVTSSGSASGTVGQSFSYLITANNGPTSYSATGLPAGLTVNSSTGLISGTPTAAGTSTATVRATNAAGTGTKSVTITINPAIPGAPVINSPGTASGTVGLPFSYTISATNSPTSFAATGLPPGLSLNTSTGVISGTPTAVGSSTVTLTATNGSGSSSTTMVMTIAAVSTASISDATGASGGRCGMGSGLGLLLTLVLAGVGAGRARTVDPRIKR